MLNLSDSANRRISMKKTISFILIVCLILSFATIAYAACPNHGTQYAHCYSTTTDIINNGSSGHTKRVTYYYECTYCDAVKPAQYWTESSTETSSHSLSTTDLGHISNTYTHKWRDSCSVCGYSNVRVVTCTSCVSLNAIVNPPK